MSDDLNYKIGEAMQKELDKCDANFPTKGLKLVIKVDKNWRSIFKMILGNSALAEGGHGPTDAMLIIPVNQGKIKLSLKIEKHIE